MKRLTAVVLFLACALGISALGAANDIRLLAMYWNEKVPVGDEWHVTGYVTHVSRISPGLFVIADVQSPTAGVIVKWNGALPSRGDIVKVYGLIERYRCHAAIQATFCQKVAEGERFPAPVAKYSDLRKGSLHARRVELYGTVAGIMNEVGSGSKLMTLAYEKSQATARLPAGVDFTGLNGRSVRLTGCVINDYDESTGRYKGCVVEVQSPGDVVVIETPSAVRWAYVVASILGVALAVLSVMFIRASREKRRLAIVTAERRRMAMDLHDTVEQHLATAKLMLSGMRMIPGLPPSAKETIANVAALLVHAKMEVRDAVQDLRSEMDKSLADAVNEVASAVSLAPDVRVRVRVSGIKDTLSASQRHDMVSIVREAATNAVKHGKPRNIVIVADGNGGREGFALRILNDGEKFASHKALGPEAGHFGLAGMRERALRSGFSISFVDKGRWCGVEIVYNR